MFSNLRRIVMFRPKNARTVIEHTNSICQKFSYIFMEKYNDLLKQCDNVSNETWANIRKSAMELEFDPAVIDSFILHTFKLKNYPDAGISYYKFLESNTSDISATTVGTYLDLYAQKNGSLTEEDKDHIFNACKLIIDKYKSFDEHMTVILVKSLCSIDKWKEAIDVINKYEAVGWKINHNVYSSLISYLFKHGEIDIGYQYLITTIQSGSGPTPEAYTAYLAYCLKEKNKFNENIEMLFNLWNKYGIKPCKEVVDTYMMGCNSMGWSAKQTKISRSTCNLCKQDLFPPSITDEEYNRLSEAILEKLIIDATYDATLRTVSEKVNMFMKFINKNKPYDIVIDGLNVLYKHNGFFTLTEMITAQKRLGKKILIVGKRHMMGLVKKFNLEDYADIYYAQNCAKDDLFVLYAAFSSGKNTIVISHDTMRQHKFSIHDAELRALLQKWQTSYQCVIVKSELRRLNSETTIDAVVQKQNNCWHVPYLINKRTPNKKHTCNNDWSCFNKHPQI